MKKRHLETKFLKFLLERYKDLEDEEGDIDTPLPDEEDKPKINSKRPIKLIDIPIEEEEEDEENGEDEDDDIIIEKLLNEYRKIKKQYESKIHDKRKRGTI